MSHARAKHGVSRGRVHLHRCPVCEQLWQHDEPACRVGPAPMVCSLVCQRDVDAQREAER